MNGRFGARGRLLLATLGLVLLLCTGVWSMSRPEPAPADAQAHRLRQALRLPGAWQPARSQEAGALVALPDVWRRQAPKVTGLQHYRLVLPAQRWTGVSAIYVPRLGNRARIWLDGELLASFGDVERGHQDYTPRPLLVTVASPAAGTAGPRVLVIEVAGTATRFSGLSDVWWGPAEELESRHAARDTLLLTSAGLAGGGSLLLGAMGIGLALWRRNSVLGFFGLAGLAAGTRALLWFWRDPALAYTVWYASLDACFGLWATSIAWFALRVADIRLPALEWGLRGLMLLMVPATLLAGLDISTRPKELWLDLTLVLAALITVALVVRAWQRPDGVSASLALGAITVLTLSGVDHWNIFFSPDGDAYVRPYFSHHMALLFGLFMTASLAARFDQAVRAEQGLRQRLADEVAAQRQELERMVAAERERRDLQAAQRERERIMQDMHDGLGAHLTGLLTMVQRGPLSAEDMEREVTEAIDQLRLTVDAAALDGATVSDVLAQLRFRLDPRMRKMGVALHWALEDLPGALGLGQASHLQKIVLEVLANALRHGRAREIRIRAQLDAGARWLRISDDGQVAWQPGATAPADMAGGVDDLPGPPAAGRPPAPARGHGLASIQRRARALGATMSIAVQAGGGTVVTLRWPDDAAPPTA